MEVLEKSVDQRIEGTQVEDRATNKMWLVVHLEVYFYCEFYYRFSFLNLKFINK